MKTKYEQFWEWFDTVEEQLYHQIEQQPEDYATLIHEKLTEIHSDFVFDIPFEMVDGKRELILSADGDASLFPEVNRLYQAAPSYQRWDIRNLRPRTNQRDQAIDLDGLYLEYEDIFVTIHNAEFPLELHAYIRGYDKEDNRYIHGYFLLLDTLLGEYDTVTYTETTAIYPFEERPPKAMRMIRFRDEFDRLKADQKSA